MARILIAQPAASIRALVEEVVTQLGHEASTSSADADALACDVLVLEPDWPEAYRLALRLLARRPGLPVVCVSRRSPSAFTGHLSFSAYLVLPAALDELERALSDAIAEAEASSS